MGAAGAQQNQNWRWLTGRRVAWLLLLTFLIGARLTRLAQRHVRLDPPARVRVHRPPVEDAVFTPEGNAPRNFTKNAILAAQVSKSLPGDDLFRDELIPSLVISVSSDAESSLSRTPRRYVRASIQEGTKVYSEVAIRLKGGPGSFRPVEDQPAFTLNFDKFHEGQTFHGLKKIHLNNSVQDRSFLKEKISRELFEAAGVPAPRAGNAIVRFNGRELGMYVLVEGANKQFLKRYFKDAKGNLYDGHSGMDVTMNMPVGDGENPRDRSGLHAVAKAAQEPDLEKRLAAFEKTLDVERFISFMAIETMLAHWDGYTMNRNNFRIYDDPASARLVFIPQGLDQVLTRPFSASIFPKTAGVVARSLLQIPEARQRYRARFAELCTNVFVPEKIEDRIHELEEKLDAAFTADQVPGAGYRSHAEAFARKIRARSKALENALSPADPITFSGAALVPLTDWHSKIDLGQADLEKQQAEGKVLLHIATGSGCTASWRHISVLDPGKYRLEAQIKTKGVELDPADKRAGAGLRISGFRTGQKNTGDRDWTPVSFEFEVSEEHAEIELVCELRANKGEVWFGQESLKLRKL